MNRLLVFIVIILLPISSLSQYYENKKTEKKSFKENLFIGGNLGLQFGTFTLIDISPIIGYKVSARFHPGIRLTYQYQSNQNTNYKTYRYGGSAFARFFLFEGFFAQAEAEALNIEWYQNNEAYRLWVPNYFVGGGYFQKIGRKSGMYITVLWNLNDSQYMLYSNPIFRMGFTF